MTSTPIRRVRLSTAGVHPGADSISSSDHPAGSASPVPRGNEGTPLDALSVAFWGSKLRMSAYADGDPPVDYDSLWPSGEDLQGAVEDFRQSELEYAVLDCCRLTVLCGPVRVLQALLAAKIVSVDQMFQPHGVTLMHMACVAQLPDMVSMLKDFRPANKADLLNRTAQELCLDRATRERLPAFRRVGGAIRRVQSRAGGSAVAKNLAKGEIFQMAAEPMKCVELLIQMQRLDFDVDSEVDDDGNCVVHIATLCGVAQMPTLLCMQRLFKADFDLYNEDGMTPLCIAAQNGCLYLTELLICVLGASPNKVNNVTGWSPLHYAASQCHTEIVLSLIRRGALVNMECKVGSLPDDIIPRGNTSYQESLQLVVNERTERMDRLTEKARSGTLHWNDVHVSDQFVINSAGNTLLMEAAESNRNAVVSQLCNLENSPINAQHFRTGLTAAAMCATGGHVSSLQQLLKHGANPTIVDMEGMIALHHACRWRNIDCVIELVKPSAGLHGLAVAKTYTNDNQVLAILDEAQRRRQDEVIKPMLFDSVAKGDLETIGGFLWQEGEDDVNVMNSYNEWPLLLAAQNGHEEIVRLLHKLGGKVNRHQVDSGNTPLHAACRGGHYAVVDFLLTFTTSQPDPAATVVAAAASSSLAGGVSSASGVKREALLDINQRNTSGHTPLELAVSQGHSRIIERLCEKGASCTLPDSSGQLLSSRQFMGVQVMLKRYRQQHMEEIVATFMRRKDLATLKSLWVSPHDHSLRSESDESPLMVACSCSAHMDVVNFLLSDIKPATQPDEPEAARPFSPWRSASVGGSSATPEAGSRARKTSTPIGLGRTRSTGDSDRSNGHGTRTPLRRSTTSLDSVLSPPGGGAQYSMATIPDADEDHEGVGNARRRLAFDASHSRSSSNASATDRSMLPDDLLDRSPSPMDASALDLDEAGALVSRLDCSESDLSITGSLHAGLPWREPQNDMLLVRGRDGGTVLHRAVRASFFKAVPALIAADSRIVNATDARGNTPLHLACANKQNRIIKLILKCPDVALNMQNCDLQLPEEVAPRGMVKALANRRMKTPNGSTRLPPPRQKTNPHDLPSPPDQQPIIRHDDTPAAVGGGSLDFDEVEQQLMRLKAAGKVGASGRMTPRVEEA